MTTKGFVGPEQRTAEPPDGRESQSGCERDATEGRGQQRVAETPEHGGFQAGRLIIGSYCSLLCHL